MSDRKTPLELERETYDRELPNMLEKHEGEHVVISGTEIIGFRKSWEEALALGYEQVCLRPFMIKKVERFEVGEVIIHGHLPRMSCE